MQIYNDNLDVQKSCLKLTSDLYRIDGEKVCCCELSNITSQKH